MTHELTGQLEIEGRGAFLVARIDSGPHASPAGARVGQREDRDEKS